MSKQRIFTLQEAFLQETNYIENRLSGKILPIHTGFPKWDETYLNGFEWGYIVALAGMSGVGKTTLLSQLETNICGLNPESNFKVLNFNYEMSARRLVGKKIASKLGKSTRQLYSADKVDNISSRELEAVKKHQNSLLKYDINYVEFPGNVKEMSETIDNFAKIKGVGNTMNSENALLVTLDHPLIVKKESEDERNMLINLMAMFNEKKKMYPKSLFVLVCQLNRDIESTERKAAFGASKILNYPQKSDIMGSDAIYQFSDAVIILHAPEKLGLLTYGPHSYPTNGLIYAHHIKARDGDSCITLFKNTLSKSKLTEISL
jgi:replicative DNA helicase